MSAPFIELQRVGKQYGDHIVLETLSSSVQRGDFVALVGASGCGKSTFLKLLLGTEAPTHGQVLLEGKPIPAEPSPERGIVFQRYSVFPHLSVRDNVLLGLELAQSPITGRLFGRGRRAALTEVDHWLQAVGLTDAAQRFPHELSGGMMQRLALAQSLIKKPAVLLLDEPFGALDPGIRKDMHALVLALWREHGLTIFMVTHDLREAFHLGTRLWVFDKVRHDPHAPHRFGSTITYDLTLDAADRADVASSLSAIQAQLGDAPVDDRLNPQQERIG